MRDIRIIAGLLFSLLLIAIPSRAQDTGVIDSMGACVDGSPRHYDAVDGTSATDCSVGSGTYDVACCCMNGSWAACASGGSSNSFATIDLPSGTDPAADSSTDTLVVTCPTPMACTGTSTPDAWAITWSGAMPDAQVDGSTEADEVVLAGDSDGAANANDLDEAAVEAEIESVVDLADLQGVLTCDQGDVFAPYCLNDPLKPPASAGTGGCIETFASGAEVCSWSWANQDSASISYDQGGALLLGDATNELHIRAIAAATNADQTFTVRLNTWWDGTSADNDMCGIIVTEGGTLAAPTSVRYTLQGDLATNGFYWMSDTDYTPAGATTLQSLSWDLTTLRSVYICHQLRYIDSTRAVGMWYSTGPECTDWAQLGSNSTLASDPLYWGFHVRQGGPCRVQRAQLRTDTDKNTWGTP